MLSHVLKQRDLDRSAFYAAGVAAARQWRAILALWALAVLLSLPFAPRVARVVSPGGFASSAMESQRAIELLQTELGTTFNNVLVIFSSDRLSADDPEFIARASGAIAGLEGWPEVEGVIPFTVNPSQVSTDRRSAYSVVLMRRTPDRALEVVTELRRRLGEPADLRIDLGGGPIFYSDIQLVSEDDLRRAELIAFPFALAALLVVFRSIVAAALPAVVGGCSVIVSLALLYLVAGLTPVSIFALNTTTLFGLGLGVDYSLFMVSRFREELAAGREVEDAVGATVATAGRAVLFSGLAVSIGLFGLTLFPLGMLRSVGAGGVLTVALSILAALTLLPALLGVLGHRVNALPVHRPWATHRRHALATRARSEESGFWHRLARAVMRRPIPVLVPVLAFLILLGTPFLGVRLAAPDASILPTGVKSRAAYDLLTERFDRSATSPIVLAVSAPGGPLARENLIALDHYVRSLQADPRVERVDSIVSLDPRLSLPQYLLLYQDPTEIGDPFVARYLAALAGPNATMVQVIGKHDALDPRSEALVRAIRNTPPPGSLTVLVDGATAGVIDYVGALYGQFPRALAVVAIVTYLALTVQFRSLVLPLKALAMNFFSILASYGALVFIFQEGHFSDLLGFTPMGFVEASAPILMFCALFGLSMDYEVFLLSRVREAYEETGDNARSVALGLERSGSIITSAAAIVILVSFAFASASMVIVKALGVGMALAVLLDATLVRGLLVPATMRLLGDLNWWWPAPLDRLLPGARPRARPEVPTAARLPLVGSDADGGSIAAAGGDR